MSRKPKRNWIQEERRRTLGDWIAFCPSCGHVTSVGDWRAAGATQGEVAFSCVGRRLPNAADAFSKNGRPCNYAGGGLIRINPVCVTTPDGEVHQVFAFAEAEEAR